MLTMLKKLSIIEQNLAVPAASGGPYSAKMLPTLELRTCAAR